MANIDRADWHYGGQFPKDLPTENGGTHIGMYLAWIIDRGLGSEELEKHVGDRLAAFRKRKVTGRDLLMSELDEKFFPSLLSHEARAFTADYYEPNTYFLDYARLLALNVESAYHVEDTWENYDRLVPILDERFAAWRAAGGG